MKLKIDEEKGYYWERESEDGKGLEVSQYFNWKDQAELAAKTGLLQWNKKAEA